MRPVHYDLDVRIDLRGCALAGTARIRLRNDTTGPCPATSFLLNRLLVPVASEGLHWSLVAMEDLPSQQVVQAVVEWPRPIVPGGEATAEIAFSGGLGDYASTGMSYIRDRIDAGFTVLRPDAFAWPVPGSPSHRALR
ncbi:MAG: hypothetical protein MUE73_11455, partial [Planctomycetes bacterium]|nr:hypothetical protein [Planctomycetota bacterium]